MTGCGSRSPEAGPSGEDSLEGFARRLSSLIDAEAARGFDGSVIDEELFASLAASLHSLQARRNPAYRSLAGERAPGDWRRLPYVPAEAFREFDMSCLEPSERSLVFRSSGTTSGERSRHFHSPSSLALYRKSLLAWLLHHLPGHARQSLLLLTPPSCQAPDSSLVHMFAQAGGSFGRCRSFGTISPRGSWELDCGRLARAWSEEAGRGRPVVLAGTAFSFVQMLDALPSLEPLPEGSALVETGGYKGRTRSIPRDQLHARLGEVSGIGPSGIVSEYGMCELSSQAYDLRPGDRRRAFRFPPWARFLAVDPETGEEAPEGNTGLIRVCDLANVWSAMAVQTSDLGRVSEGGFELAGRVSDALPRGCSLLPGD